MRLFPIIPVWIMTIICAILIVIIWKSSRKNFRQIIIVSLLFIINLRIMISSNNSQSLANNLDVLFVIDNTISMNAEDYDGTKTRLYAVKKDCKYIIKRLNGARFSVITFNNTAKVNTPYTKDANITNEAIDIIEPLNELYAKGSSLNTPIDTIISSLESSQKKENRTRILFFISDGEITDDSTLKSFKEIAELTDNGAILGYGSKKGGYMRVKDDYSERYDYLTDPSKGFEKAISKVDESNLKKIAKDINVDYIYMTKQSNINKKLEEIKNMINTNDIEANDKSTYTDTYYIFVIPLLILLMIEFNKFRRRSL